MVCAVPVVSGFSPNEIKSKAYHSRGAVPIMVAPINSHGANPHWHISTGTAVTAVTNATSSPATSILSRHAHCKGFSVRYGRTAR